MMADLPPDFRLQSQGSLSDVRSNVEADPRRDGKPERIAINHKTRKLASHLRRISQKTLTATIATSPATK